MTSYTYYIDRQIKDVEVVGGRYGSEESAFLELRRSGHLCAGEILFEKSVSLIDLHQSPEKVFEATVPLCLSRNSIPTYTTMRLYACECGKHVLEVYSGDPVFIRILQVTEYVSKDELFLFLDWHREKFSSEIAGLVSIEIREDDDGAYVVFSVQGKQVPKDQRSREAEDVVGGLCWPACNPQKRARAKIEYV